MLIILGGLPGTGKTTIAKQLVKQLNAVYLRVDTVEQIVKRVFDTDNLGPAGYMICWVIAAENLSLGRDVIADSVNPIDLTRSDWRDVANNVHSEYVEIELVCSDEFIHKHRIETRKADIPGHSLPSWEEVINRPYEPWETKTLSLDTSKHSVEESVRIILDCIEKNRTL